MTSLAKATKGKAGTAVVTDHVRRSTTGTGLRVGAADAVQPATSEIMDVTAGETAPYFVAALYVETGGCYFGLPNIDPWDIDRDARLYAGPHPVVAHPPCDRWHQLSAVNNKRWGYVINEDGGCFAAALVEAVRKYGGGLEHPAESRAFKFHDIPEPVADSWQSTIDGDWVTEVWQSSYGHGARKRTWLLYHGATMPPVLEWRRVAGKFQIGFFDQKLPQLPKAERAATPQAFRDLLLSIAGASMVTSQDGGAA